MSIFLSLLLLFFIAPVSPSSSPDHYTKSLPSYHKPTEYLELKLARPLLSNFLVLSCSKQILHHSFANIINAPPFSTRYSMPSDCLSLSSDCLDFDLFRPFRSVSVAGRYDPFQPELVISPDTADSDRVSTNQPNLARLSTVSVRVVEKKMWQIRLDATPTRGQRHPLASPHRAASNAGAAPQTASPCFPGSHII